MSTVESNSIGIQRLLPRHFKIIELALAGHDNKVIAEAVGLSVGTVGVILRSHVVQSEMARRRQEQNLTTTLGQDRDATVGKARMLLERACENAAITLENALLDEKPAIRLRAAEQILDRALGNGGSDRRAVVVNVTAEQLSLLTLALKESGHEKPRIVANSPSTDSSEGGTRDVYEDSRLIEGPPNDGSADSPEGESLNVYQEASDGSKDE